MNIRRFGNRRGQGDGEILSFLFLMAIVSILLILVLCPKTSPQPPEWQGAVVTEQVATVPSTVTATAKAVEKVEATTVPVTVSVVKYDLSHTTTVGNHSYVEMGPFGRQVNPAAIVEHILNLLDKFEKEHPALRVTSWAIEKCQWANGSTAEVFGLWVNHEPKKDAAVPGCRF